LKRNQFIFLLVLVALFVMIWSGVYNYLSRKQAEERRRSSQAVLVPDSSNGSQQQDQGTVSLEGKPAPNFTLVDLQGRKVSLADYKGKAVLVNFWATWCAPCKVEIPWFTKLHDQYAAKGFEILGVSNDDLDKDDQPKLREEKAAIGKFVADMHMNYPVLLDADSIAQHYGGVDSLPTSFFVDRNGVVVAQTIGLVSRDEVEANIQKALGGQ
jgi:peroxiredoxin